MRYMLVYRCLSTAFLLTIIFRQRAASWSSLVTDVVDILVAVLVFAIIRKFIWTSSSLLTTELHGRWAGRGGGGGIWHNGYQPKAKWDTLWDSLQMLESRSVINYCIPIIISNAITHSLFDVPNCLFLLLLVIH